MFAVRTSDIESDARRLGFPLLPLSTSRPDGDKLSWSLLGIVEGPVAGDVFLPFFIAMDNPFTAPNAALTSRAGHLVRPTGIDHVNVSGDPDRPRSWLGGRDVSINCAPGDARINSFAVSTSDGVLVID